MLDSHQLAELLGTAAGILDAASSQFVNGHRADSAVEKKGNDFATDVDLALEKRITAELTRLTGIGVHGEEFGGEALDAAQVWVLDPIDGTFNYAAGLPMAAMLLALLVDGEPVLGLTWLPFTAQRYTALVDGPVHCNDQPVEKLRPAALADVVVATGTYNIDSRGRYPGRYRAAMLANLSRECSRMRMHGSTGIDFAYVAAGILGGAISFGHHVWDHAAGVALVRAAGGVVTDLAGKPWTIESPSALVAAPGVHERMLELIGAAGDPEDYR
ncbi:inositol monophosphatase [Mycolicibacterium duvalii]|uniref:inositol-phosphate phosphatase n=1 Tax=Mycolicibacterium duvalii TaxID=39688 RepID=A0A7I7JXS1_9MYCO|nr:inositol monophosphatase family protein [Mycolicibacterium duvalii]MCV7366857.1 inositol monophosphatase family protein [Mycolicibacterium duvalii]PEG43976.1 inositol monophosphatase [Mycolicibacterium duvalii]BBX16680.1 inositol-1-monophosphatase ImpA [Mycolicibacterium duvalii]